MFKVYKNLDWLSITLHFGIVPDWIVGTSIEKLDRSPLRNYNTATRGSSGSLVLTHSEQSQMGTHIILSGDTLGVLRGEGNSDVEICEFAINHHTTRIDIAVTAEQENYYSEHLTPRRIQRMADSGQIKSRLKLDKGVDNSGNLETCYIGSRKSRNRILRVYDKGIDLGLEANKYIRYELETRKNADGVTRAVAQGQDIGGIIRRYVDFPQCDDWINIMDAPSVTMPQIENNLTQAEKDTIEKSNRWHWLMTSVAPALAKALYYDNVEPENNENLRLFNIHVHNKLMELRNQNG